MEKKIVLITPFLLPVLIHVQGSQGTISPGTEPGFKLRVSRSSLFKDLKKIIISILKVEKVALLALMY